ncbi:Methionyl-tRNA formyltransferase [Buchnera aphidicola (Tetraneura ulmi)]|uniref:methionyl-tRNA formyltransferase n=1 Tax=Buchnera aphidicola TaxID=9 RepID=UPI0034640BDC
MKIIFAGTPEFAAKHLKKLLEKKYKIIAVLTKPDQPANRGGKKFSPVKILAKKMSIPILQPKKFEKESKKTVKILKKLNPDLLIIVAYGIILSKKIIKIFTFGGINVHASLLPRWRGASPIQQSILSGDKKTGISIILINKKMDEGDIFCSKEQKIKNDDTTLSLTKKLAYIGSKLLISTLKKIKKKRYSLTKQNHELATYCKKIKKEHGKINWSLTAEEIDRKIRAYIPWPTSYFVINKIHIKIFQSSVIIEKKIKNKEDKKIGSIISIKKDGIKIQTIKNILKIEKIQFPGKKIITISDLINAKNNLFFLGLILK